MKTNEVDDKVFDEKGSLLLFRKATASDIDLMMKLMPSERYEFISLFREVIQDDTELLKLLDMMSGVKITFPERRKIYKTLEKVFMYNYIKAHNFTQSSYVAMSKQYGKRVTQVKAIIETMLKNLGEEHLLDNLDNKE